MTIGVETDLILCHGQLQFRDFEAYAGTAPTVAFSTLAYASRLQEIFYDPDY